MTDYQNYQQPYKPTGKGAVVVVNAPTLAKMVDDMEKNSEAIFALSNKKEKTALDRIKAQERVEPWANYRIFKGRAVGESGTVFPPDSENQKALASKIKRGSRVTYLIKSGLNTDGSLDLVVRTGKAALPADGGGWVCQARKGCDIAELGMLVGKA